MLRRPGPVLSQSRPTSNIVSLAGLQMSNNMGPEFTTRFQAVFPEAAKELKSSLIPYLLDGIGGAERLNQPDGIHPTIEGQGKVAENGWKALQAAITQSPAIALFPRTHGLIPFSYGV